MADEIDYDGILIAEFQYIAQTAFQANEDRAKVSNLYIVTVGSFLAAILGLQLDGAATPTGYTAFALLFGLLGVYGILTLFQLVRLRHAWFDSARAMNAIKQYYISRGQAIQLDTAFHWKPGSLPPKFKPRSVSFLIALQVILIDSIAVGGVVAFLGLAQGAIWTTSALVVGLIAFVLQVVIYRWLLWEEK